MAIRYVRKVGSDANGGTSPSDAWLTIGKALGASGIASGDTVWIGAGVYRELVDVLMTNPTAETFVLGDVDGSHTGDAGEVRLTAWLTNDTTAAAVSAPLLDLNGKDNFTFRNLHIVGVGTAVFLDVTSDGGPQYCNNIKFTECTIRGRVWGGGGAAAFGIPANWLFDRCVFSDAIQNIEIAGDRGTGSDYDIGIVFENCVFLTGITTIYCDSVTAGDDLPGGPTFRNCTFFGNGTIDSSGISPTFPMTFHNCLFTGWNVMNALVSGEIVEDYNVFLSAVQVAFTNVTPGANSKDDYAPLYHIGEELQYGAQLRPFGSPSRGSPLLAFGGTSPPAVDILNAPRPAGGASSLTAVGAYERGNTFGKETGTVRSGANAISITGPGYQDWYLRVAAVSTTVTVYARWDATYAGTKPKLQVLGGTECGVADATDTATGSSGAWEELSLTFTPTSAGVVRIRFLSSDTNGAGKMFVDDFLRVP